MTADDSKNGADRKQRLWRFAKKVLIGATFLFVISKIGDFVSRNTGWTSWGKFDTTVTRFDSALLEEIGRVSPISLYYDLKAPSTIAVVDTAAKNAVDRYNAERLQRLICGESPLQVPPQKFYPGVTIRTVTLWEKIKSWCVGFWYDDDSTANWFGRIVLFISLLLAIPLTWKSGSSTFLASDWYPINIIVALLYLTFFCLFLYALMTFLLFIAGSIVALFSSIAATGGFLKYLLDEVKSETLDHSKSKVEPLLDSVTGKK